MNAQVEEWLTPSAAAREIGVSSEQVRRWTREGRLDHIVTPLGRLINPKAVAAMVAARQGSAA